MQQLDAVGGGPLAGLASRVPGVVAGGDTVDGVAVIDVDDTIGGVHGYARPSGKYPANAAWVACPVIGFHIARATAVAADLAKARWASLRAKIVNVPAPIASTGRRLVLHLPVHWPWAEGWESLHAVATGPPKPTTT